MTENPRPGNLFQTVRFSINNYLKMDSDVAEKAPLLYEKHISEAPESFIGMLKYATKYDLILFSIGTICTISFSICPILLIASNGEMIEILEDYTNDYDELYESEKELAFINYMLAVLTLFVGCVAVVAFSELGLRQGLFWKQACFRSISTKPMHWFDRQNPTDLSNTLDRNCNAIERALGYQLMLIFSALLFFMGSWIYSAYLSLELTLLVFAKLPVQYLSYFLVQASYTETVRQSRDAMSSAEALAAESLEGIKTVASCNAQQRRALKYQAALEPLKRVTSIMGAVAGVGWGLLFFDLFLFVGIIYYVGAVLIEDEYDTWNDRKLSAKTVFIVCFTTSISSFYLNSSLSCISDVKNGKIAASKANQLIESKVIDDEPNITHALEGSISFQNVYFNYPTHSSINTLQGLSFSLSQGSSLAVVGVAGSGKSTIIHLIEGFYYCSQGIIRIDGKDIRDYDLSALREGIALVSQDPVLFCCSIKENIRIGKVKASDAEIKAAAVEAEASTFIESLPSKYETSVGTKGLLVPDGEKQRIALARAVIKNPRVLLLDDIASSLDGIEEMKMQRTISKVMLGRTTIITSQRLLSVSYADNIILVNQGKILEEGTFDQMMHREGPFKTLLNIQSEAEKGWVSVELRSPRTPPPVSFGENPENPEEQQPKQALNTAFRIFAILKCYWSWLLLALFSALLTGASIPIFSYLLASNTNTLIGLEGDDKSEDTLSNLLLISITAASVLVGILLMCVALARVAALLLHDLRWKSLQSILFYDQRFYDNTEVTADLSRACLSNDCEKVARLGGPVLVLQALVVCCITGGILIAMMHDVILALVAIIFLPIILILEAKCARMSGNWIETRKNRQTSAIAVDTFVNIRNVQAFNRQEYFYEKFNESACRENEGRMRNVWINGLVFGCRYALFFILWGSVAWFGGYRVKEGNLDLDDLLISFFCIFFTSIGFMIIGFLAPDLKGGMKSGRQLFSILDYKPDINAKSLEGYYGPIEGSLEFKQVDFKYENRDIIVLRSLSFSVNEGGSLGITGASGSGKSTIASLLLRFYDPTAGEIYLGSMPLRTYNIRHLRNSICWVGQDPMLFKGSILYNLQMAMPCLTADDAMEVLNRAQAKEIIDKYGIDCEVGEKGCNLSTGQRQRIAIARAIVRDPRILVMDEATCALDFDTEERVLTAIKHEKLTIISIAGRLQSIRDCDQILLIEKGTVIETGTHDELVKIENGYYREIFEKFV